MGLGVQLESQVVQVEGLRREEDRSGSGEGVQDQIPLPGEIPKEIEGLMDTLLPCVIGLRPSPRCDHIQADLILVLDGWFLEDKNWLPGRDHVPGVNEAHRPGVLLSEDPVPLQTHPVHEGEDMIESVMSRVGDQESRGLEDPGPLPGEETIGLLPGLLHIGGIGDDDIDRVILQVLESLLGVNV